MTTAVVLAGGPPDDVAHTQPGAPNKAFITIAGITLVERTLRALRASKHIERIIVVAPQAAHDHPALARADERRPDGEKISTSLANGLANLPSDDLVLVSASDLPILTQASVDDFIERANAIDPDIGYECIEKTIHERAYPHVPHTWARLKGGTYCGGGFIAIKPRVLPALTTFIEQLGAARKNPLHLAKVFGLPTLAKFAIGQLTINAAESRASQLLGAKARAIISPYAETGVNVDRVSDIALAETLVNQQP